MPSLLNILNKARKIIKKKKIDIDLMIYIKTDTTFSERLKDVERIKSHKEKGEK